ncbi:MAG: cytochrome C [Burkholderiales bacterium]|nr:cytochrome C [Burkholderiales bacterium]
MPPRAQGAVPQPPPSRGKLLYETHCITCHTSKMHWRDGRIVRDWLGLVEQVRRWQDTDKLQWSDADIVEVARYLNDAIYRLPKPAPA